MKLSTLVGASGLSATATPAKGASLFGRIANLHSVISKGNHVQLDREDTSLRLRIDGLLKLK